MSNVSTDEATAAYLQHETSSGEANKWAHLIEALDAAATDICVDCGENLGGFFGTFTWGFVNGQGSCSRCGFPYLYLHRFPGASATRDVILKAFVPIAEMPLQENDCRTCGGRGFLDRFDEGLTTYGPVTAPCPECSAE